MLRVILLPLLVLASLAVIVPLDYSSANTNQSSVSEGERSKHVRSKRRAWRRNRSRLARRRAWLRRKRLAMIRRRQMIAAQRRLAARVAANRRPVGIRRNPVSETNKNNFSLIVPAGWTRELSNPGEAKFNIRTTDGRAAGTAVISEVNVPLNTANLGLMRGLQRRSIGNVPFTSLREVIIEKMLKAKGWIVNDMEREVAGRRVFMVHAQTPESGRNQTWVYYFTESESKVYCLALNGHPETIEPLISQSEQLIASFRSVDQKNLAEKSTR
jgi:hypothetical protein